MDVSSAAMEGEYDPGRADAEDELAAARGGRRQAAWSSPESAQGVGQLGQSDLDELHHRRDH